jgi:hypothetical protein
MFQLVGRILLKLREKYVAIVNLATIGANFTPQPAKAQGLYNSPELVAQAQAETTATITRTMLTLVGFALFCTLSLQAPDLSLLIGTETLNVPLAGPVSFQGFIVVGPIVLIALRVYLQIYVEHWCWLESIRRQDQVPAAIIEPLQASILKDFTAFVLYLLLPLTMVAFTWKAAVFPAWGAGLMCVTVAVIACHIVLPLSWSWWSKVILSTIIAIIVLPVVLCFQESLSRPFDLFRANLSNQWLASRHLTNANLRFANLKAADLAGANLKGAHLASANLEDAYLWRTQLQGANLSGAQLQGAGLARAQLQGADLREATLQGANLRHVDASGANFKDARFNLVDLRDLDYAPLKEAQYDTLKESLESQVNNPKHLKRVLARLKKRIGKTNPLGLVAPAKQCLSDESDLVPGCFENRQSAYQQKLTAYFVNLACSDTVVARALADQAIANVRDY